MKQVYVIALYLNPTQHKAIKELCKDKRDKGKWSTFVHQAILEKQERENESNPK